MPSRAIARAFQFERLRDESVTWRLLNADNAHLIAALLGEHLGHEERQLPTAELHERIDAELDELRDHGVALPQTAQSYCADWRGAGYLVRRPSAETRGETYELSAGALNAIRVLDGLVDPGSTVTESRLANISARINQLAIDTDPDTSRRLEQLHARKRRIEDDIERLGSGELDMLDTDRAEERIRDILTEAAEIPSDFARVRAKFEEINHMLRVSILESDDAARHVLDDVFRGVDVIAESDEGRTFSGFNSLVLDPALGAAFDADVDQLLSRTFTGSLPGSQRRFLRRFIRTLKERSADIDGVLASFARGLRRYVQSQEFQRDRVLRRYLQDALAAAVPASQTIRPYATTSLDLDLSSVTISSIGSIQPHNPADLDAAVEIPANETGTVDLAALRQLVRETEIDFDELHHNIEGVLAEAQEPTIGDILEKFPATQGVASIVGLLAIAASEATSDDGAEQVGWTGTDGAGRTANIPLHRFARRT